MALIYLAGKWEEAHIIKQYADRLRAHGHAITTPWFESHTGPEIEIPALKEQAIADVDGVRRCLYFIGIFEKYLPYSGAVTELGMAIAFGKVIYIIGHGIERNIFTHLPSVVHYDTFDKFMEELT